MPPSSEHSKVEPGSSVAVFGCGGVGLSAIQGAVIAGARRIVAIDTLEPKLEMAKRFGATDTVLATKDEDVAITVTKAGYIKRTPVSTYTRQGRGGKGIRAGDARDEVLRIDPAGTITARLALSEQETAGFDSELGGLALAPGGSCVLEGQGHVLLCVGVIALVPVDVCEQLVRLGEAEVIPGCHCVALSHPRELAAALASGRPPRAARMSGTRPGAGSSTSVRSSWSIRSTLRYCTSSAWHRRQAATWRCTSISARTNARTNARTGTRTSARRSRSASRSSTTIVPSARPALRVLSVSVPIDGVVIQRSVDEGQTVQASMNAPTDTPMSATLNVGQRSEPTPTSMKSTTPRGQASA